MQSSPHLVPAARWPKARLASPSDHGFVYVGADSGTWRLPWALPTPRRAALVTRLQETARALERDSDVLQACVFVGLVRPPGGRPVNGDRAPSARFDAVLLVETATPEAAGTLVESSVIAGLLTTLGHSAHSTTTFAGFNARQIAPVDHDRQGVFLFNYFSASSVEENLAAWEYTAGWFQDVTRLDNSTVLLPLPSSPFPYTMLNHCRWDALSDVLPDLVFRPSFRSFVLGTFAARGVTPRPLLYRLAARERRTTRSPRKTA